MKNKSVQDNDIYVHISFDCNGKEVSEYTYSLSYYGNYELECISESDAREIIRVLTAALEVTKKQEGGTGHE